MRTKSLRKEIMRNWTYNYGSLYLIPVFHTTTCRVSNGYPAFLLMSFIFSTSLGPRKTFDSYLLSLGWSMTNATSDLYCMKYFITYAWFRFKGRSSSSTFTTAFRRSRNCGALLRCSAARVMIFWTCVGKIRIQQFLFPVKTWKQIPCWLELWGYYKIPDATYKSWALAETDYQ